MERLERLVHELDQCGRIILLLIVEEEEETMDVEDTEEEVIMVNEVDHREANLKEEEEVDSKISHHHQGEIFLGEVLMAMRKDLSLR